MRLVSGGRRAVARQTHPASAEERLVLAAGPAITLRSFLASRAAAGIDWALAAEGKIHHSPQERRLIIYSRCSVLPQWSKHQPPFQPGPGAQTDLRNSERKFPELQLNSVAGRIRMGWCKHG